jgi:hypothetical protein
MLRKIPRRASSSCVSTANTVWTSPRTPPRLLDNVSLTSSPKTNLISHPYSLLFCRGRKNSQAIPQRTRFRPRPAPPFLLSRISVQSRRGPPYREGSPGALQRPRQNGRAAQLGIRQRQREGQESRVGHRCQRYKNFLFSVFLFLSVFFFTMQMPIYRRHRVMLNCSLFSNN